MRSQIDDAPILLPEHIRNHRLTHIEGRVQVELDHAIEFIVRHLMRVRVAIFFAGGIDTVQHHIDIASLLHDLIDGVLHLLGIRHIAMLMEHAFFVSHFARFLGLRRLVLRLRVVVLIALCAPCRHRFVVLFIVQCFLSRRHCVHRLLPLLVIQHIHNTAFLRQTQSASLTDSASSSRDHTDVVLEALRQIMKRHEFRLVVAIHLGLVLRFRLSL
mmetsp:Transcript_41214/g.66284  ORF Transcript_41214/g.66284 Transcript_41214/m.66284 type:complete len:215 (+) Transcript_41214:504-1148(+)